jgi:hypothetical protein
MNLINRIKKLESRNGTGDGEFCDCYDKFYVKMIDKVYNGTPFDETSAELPDGEFCEKCQLPLSARILQFNKGLQLAYGDFNFEAQA